MTNQSDPAPAPDRGRWVLLSYRLPREPSTPRIAVWRRLKALGVAQLGDGLVALPLDARSREQLEWVADEIRGHGGDADLWLAEPTRGTQERRIAAGMVAARVEECTRITAEAVAAIGLEPGPRARALARLRRELRAARRRDYFATAEAQNARLALDDLAAAVRGRASDQALDALPPPRARA